MNYQDRREARSWGPLIALALQVCLALGFAFHYLPAHAQAPDPAVVLPNPCGVPDPKIIRLYYDWQTGQKATCAPGPIGKGTLPTIRYNSAGIHGWAWCPLADGTWGLQLAAVTWDRALQLQLVADAAAIAHAADPVDALARIADKNISTPLADPTLTPVWCPNIKEMYASRPLDVVIAPPPVVSAWVTSGRSVYSSSGGRLGAFLGLTTTGLACDCAKPIVVGTVTYCPFTGAAPNSVASCKRSP